MSELNNILCGASTVLGGLSVLLLLGLGWLVFEKYSKARDEADDGNIKAASLSKQLSNLANTHRHIEEERNKLFNDNVILNGSINSLQLELYSLKKDQSSLPQPIDWTLDDAHKLSRFLASDVGIRLFSRARSMEYNRAVANARSGGDHAAGITVGISDTLNWIHSLGSQTTIEKLSRPSGAQEENTTDGDGETDLVEHLSP